jgi:2-hydroxychromene-2-carboxylate isomerase
VSGPAVFYFDLASPLAYLASEQVMNLVSGPVEWQPVLSRELPGLERGPAGLARELPGLAPELSGPQASDSSPCQTEAPPYRIEEQSFREEIVRSAERLGLQPLRWPRPFPFDSSLAMRAATYAKSIGRAIPFAQAAFRQAFAGGHNLEQPDFVLIAAAACEMHPNAVLRGTELRSVREQLTDATEEAARAGVSEVPALRIGAR